MFRLFSFCLLMTLMLVLAAPAAGQTRDPEAGEGDDDYHRELERMTVRALPLDRNQLESAQPVDIVTGDALDDSRGATIGETLDTRPGVHSTFFGRGAARPVIRGLGGNRVRMQEDGLSSADASAQSDDHAVAVEPLLIDSIEILRGPSTLLYGSGAVGGVVNIIDHRIPERMPDRPLEGRYELRGDTVSDERAGVFRLDGGAGNLAWHVDGSWRDSNDYDIPGFAEREEAHDDDDDGDHEEEIDEERIRGRIPNSFAESRAGTVGLSWIGRRGYIGASFRVFDTEYGVPGHAHEHGHEEEDHDDDGDDHDEAEEEEIVTIDMRQKRWDVKGGLMQPLPGFDRVSLRMGYNEYTHTEFEGDEVGTVFDVEAFETRVELNHRPVKGWEGALGFQYEDEDFLAEGEEAFVPDTNSRAWGLFLLEERHFGNLRLSAGARVEDARVKRLDGADRRSFTSTSFSLGGVYEFDEHWQASLNLSRAQRAPDQAELFANGPHVATRTFEVGDPELDRETTRGADFTVHGHWGPVDLRATAFVNRVDDFIYLADTGEEADDLPLREYNQNDARFRGVELEAVWEVHETGLGDWDLRAFYDQVRGRLDDGENLPRISPVRYGAGIDWYRGPWRAGVEAYRVRSQDRTAPFESGTGGYSHLNARVSREFWLGDTRMALFLQSRNLTDQQARVHTSFLKDFAPLPGRNVTLGVRGEF